MIKILFSPSEGKRFENTHTSMKLFGGLAFRKEILQKYHDILSNKNYNILQELFGLKKQTDIQPYLIDIFQAQTTKAILRYDGVAYDYINYLELSKEAQGYIDQHLFIFSNLFGVLKADDLIPLYKVKQTKMVGTIKPEIYYKSQLQPLLDEALKNEEILDLRAGYYDKFYKPPFEFTTLKFLKNNKVVSHWAKAYRGIIVREMAKHNIQTLKELQQLEIENLIIKEIKKIKNKTEIVYEIKN